LIYAVAIHAHHECFLNIRRAADSVVTASISVGPAQCNNFAG